MPEGEQVEVGPEEVVFDAGSYRNEELDDPRIVKIFPACGPLGI